MNKPKESVNHLCSVSGKVIPEARVEFLKESGIPESEWTTVEHSPVKRKQGIYTGEYGTSTMLIVDKIYDDSVRTVLAEQESEEDNSE